jgi:hypothetical protein
MNSKVFGRNPLCPNRGTISEFSWRDWGKLGQTSVRITGVPVEIRSEYLSNTSLERHRYTILLGHKVCKIAKSASGKCVGLYAIIVRVSTLLSVPFTFVLCRLWHQRKEVSDSSFSVPAICDSDAICCKSNTIFIDLIIKICFRQENRD